MRSLTRVLITGAALAGMPAPAAAQRRGDAAVEWRASAVATARASTSPRLAWVPASATRPPRVAPYVLGGALLGAAAGVAYVARIGDGGCADDLALAACRLLRGGVVVGGAGLGALAGLGVAHLRRRAPAT